MTTLQALVVGMLTVIEKASWALTIIDSLPLSGTNGIVRIKWNSLQVLEGHFLLVEDKLLLLGNEGVKDLLLVSDKLGIVLADKLDLHLCRFQIHLASRNI